MANLELKWNIRAKVIDECTSLEVFDCTLVWYQCDCTSKTVLLGNLKSCMVNRYVYILYSIAIYDTNIKQYPDKAMNDLILVCSYQE